MANTSQKYNVEVVHHVMGLAINSDMTGVSKGHYGTIVHVINPAQETIAQTALNVMNSLLLAVDKSTIAADDVEVAVISMATVDAALDWLLVLDNEIIGSGTEAAAAGSVILDFAIDTPGTYEIWFVRRTGDYASGFVTVEAT